MVECNYHFLDTNIVLALILPNDGSKSESAKYFTKSSHEKYFSNTAFKEAKNVINNWRRVSLKIIDCIKNYLTQNLINSQNVNTHFRKIKELFLKRYHDDDFPENMKKENFENVITIFFNDYASEIKQILIDDKVSELDAFSKDIRDAFKQLHNDLISFLDNLICISFVEENTKLKELIAIGIHKPDNVLINEAFVLSSFLNQIVGFVTFDNGILNYHKEIIKLFSSKIHVLSPIDI